MWCRTARKPCFPVKVVTEVTAVAAVAVAVVVAKTQEKLCGVAGCRDTAAKWGIPHLSVCPHLEIARLVMEKLLVCRSCVPWCL